MKVLIIKKRVLYFSLFTILTLTVASTLFFFNFNEDEMVIFNPLPNSKPSQYDLTGDGDNDIIKIIDEKNKADVQILSKGRTFLLSSLCDNHLVDSSTSWPIKVFAVNISRDNRYELLIQGTKNTKPISYLIGWFNGKFILLNESDSNINGILDSTNSRTPQFITLHSSNTKSSIKSYMFQDYEKIDTSSNTYPLPNLDNIFSFINLIQTKYELDELPNIFSESISSNDLSILWSLNKEIYEYSFQDGFFYDNKFGTTNEITSMKWRLTFEKYNKSNPNSPKDGIAILLDFVKTTEGFKISNIIKEEL